MPSNTTIAAAIADAQALAVTPEQIVALLDKAIAAAFVGGLAVVTYAIAGRSRTIDLASARELRSYYAGLNAGGGMIYQGIEFAP